MNMHHKWTDLIFKTPLWLLNIVSAEIHHMYDNNKKDSFCSFEVLYFCFTNKKNEYETILNLLQLEYRDSQNKVPQNRIKRI